MLVVVVLAIEVEDESSPLLLLLLLLTAVVRNVDLVMDTVDVDVPVDLGDEDELIEELVADSSFIRSFEKLSVDDEVGCGANGDEDDDEEEDD